MSPKSKKFRLAVLVGFFVLAGPARAASARCEAAWEVYRDLKAHTVMEESQYPLTLEGAEVRAACGRAALPAPPDADLPPRHRVIRGSPLLAPMAPRAPGAEIRPPATRQSATR